MGLFACSFLLQDPAKTSSQNAALSCKSLLPYYLQLLWDQEVPNAWKTDWVFQANLESQEAQIVWITYSQALQFMGAYPNQTLNQVTHPSVTETPLRTRCAAKCCEVGPGSKEKGQGQLGMDCWSQALEGREGAITLLWKHGQTAGSRRKQSIREGVFNMQLWKTHSAAPRQM